jgi:NADH-quinone oxidoreductase subunit A
MNSLLAVIVLGVLVVTFGAGVLSFASLLGPKTKPDGVKEAPYECGVTGVDSGHTNINVKFYLTAILFILFDIEIIFMYPWAVTFLDFMKQGLGLYVLGAMGVFILLFVLGLIWEVKSKALEWD